jgi:hypothetical protein
LLPSNNFNDDDDDGVFLCCGILEEPHHTDFLTTGTPAAPAKTTTSTIMSPLGFLPGSKNNNNSTHSSTSRDGKQASSINMHHPHHSSPDLGGLVGQWAVSAGQTMRTWTAKRYGLPDKTVASQILMYRQLLHTSCRPGLKLSRPYQATPAQKAVQHMPWWEKQTDESTGRIIDMEETGKMIISYDNLITRLWNVGTTTTCDDRMDRHNQSSSLSAAEAEPPPIPHEYWVSRLGFQQPDPVTDFRSGGILSLAMMVWIVESCPHVYHRFCRHHHHIHNPDPASVLPFGITSINVTGMMSKFLMLSKSTDRMDALLSQKPFWNMFSDPNALLACQELALDMLADVVQEIDAVRRCEQQQQQHATMALVDVVGENQSTNNPSHPDEQTSGTTTTTTTTTATTSSADLHHHMVTVFDFSHILSVTERRVEYDLLGAGPVSVKELRLIHKKIQIKYKQQLEKKLERIRNINQNNNNNPSYSTPEKATAESPTDENVISSSPSSSSMVDRNMTTSNKQQHQVLKQASDLGATVAASGIGAAVAAGSWFSKVRNGGTPTSSLSTTPQTPRIETDPNNIRGSETIAEDGINASSSVSSNQNHHPPSTATKDDLFDGWTGVDRMSEHISTFSIGDDDEDVLL